MPRLHWPNDGSTSTHSLICCIPATTAAVAAGLGLDGTAEGQLLGGSEAAGAQRGEFTDYKPASLEHFCSKVTAHSGKFLFLTPLLLSPLQVMDPFLTPVLRWKPVSAARKTIAGSSRCVGRGALGFGMRAAGQAVLSMHCL
jgi:hypothetical protein